MLYACQLELNGIHALAKKNRVLANSIFGTHLLPGAAFTMNKKETYNTPDQNDARQRKIKRIYLVTATTAALAFTMAMPAFAANDPLATINALSDFVFSAIKAIGAILLADRSCPERPRCQPARAGLYDLFGWCHHLLCQGYSGYDSVRLFHYTGLFSRKILYYIEQDSDSFNQYNEVMAVAPVTNGQAIKHCGIIVWR